MKRFDVIVVGAGPAGSSAARACAHFGLSVLLLEKERIPRFKVCGGGLSLAAWREIGFPLPERLLERTCYGMRLTFGRFKNAAWMKSDRNGGVVAYMVTRADFDEYLSAMAAEAGAELCDGEECRSVERDAYGVQVQTTKGWYRANILIGADGYFSRVRRTFGTDFGSDEVRFCLTMDIPLPESEITDRTGNLVSLHYGYVKMGYAWLFPKRDHISAGIGGSCSNGKELKEDFQRFLRMHDLPDHFRMKGCYLPISRFRQNAYSDRVMLTGDAAGFVDSFSGEGIRFARASGRIAAATAANCHVRKDFSLTAMEAYQEACRRAFIRDLTWSHVMTDLTFRFPNLILGTAVSNREVMSEYLKTMTGEMGVEEFFKWLRARYPLLLLKRVFRRF